LNRHVLLLAFALAPATALPTLADEAPRGPAEIRDAQLLAQPRLTLPALSPHPTAPGAWAVQVSAFWASSFSWKQDIPGETPQTRLFLVDGEALVLDATVRRGLGKDVDVGLRVPFQSRGGGSMDGLIDWWHRLVHVPSGERPSFLMDAFRVEGVTTDLAPFSWNDHTGSGLGDLELETRWRARDGGASRTSVSLVGRVSLPTGTGPFAGNGVGGGGQVVLGTPLGRSWDLYGGAGFTAQDPGPVRGVRYEPLRAHGFLAVEWRPWRRTSLVAETNAASRLVDNIYGYPGLHWIVNLTGRVDLGGRTRLDLGFTENIESQLTTTDFALYLGFAFRP
jgi:hypothetical protein